MKNILLIIFLFSLSCSRDEGFISVEKKETKKTRFANKRCFTIVDSGTRVIKIATVNGNNSGHYISMYGQIQLSGDSVNYVLGACCGLPQDTIYSLLIGEEFPITNISEEIIDHRKLFYLETEDILDDGCGQQYIKYVGNIVDIP
jgi:hypothetical protein